MEISKGRAILSVRDLQMWQDDLETYLVNNPKYAECFKDPSRLFNQDESAVEIGSSQQRVLAEVGSKILYHISGASQEHITMSFTCSADGSLVPPRCIYRGVRNTAQTH